MSATPQLQTITVSSDGAALGVAAPGVLFRQIETEPSDAGDWETISTTVALTQLSATSVQDVWGVTGDGQVYRSQGAAFDPQPQQFLLDQVAAASDGTVWGVLGGVAQRLSGDALQPVPSPEATVRLTVAGGGAVFALDAAGTVWSHQPDDTWLPLAPAPPSGGIDVSASEDGLLWAVGNDHNLYLYADAAEGWVQAGTGLQRISAATSAAVWAIDTQGYARVMAAGEPLGDEGRVGPGEGIKRWDTESTYNFKKSTHLWIVYQAARLAGQAVTALIQPTDSTRALGDPFHDQLCRGIHDADFKDPWNDPWGIFRYYPIGPVERKAAMYSSHFYDPDSGRNWRGDTHPTALTRVRELTAYATQRWQFGDPAGAGYHLGLALHYLTDATQPMHAGNFTYTSSDPWGWHTAFERSVMDLTGNGSVDPPSNYVASTLTAPEDFVTAAARNAKTKYLTTVTPSLVSQAERIVVQGHLVVAKSWETEAATLFSGMTGAVTQMLQDAILVTAQFLTWWQSTIAQGAGSAMLVCTDSGQLLTASSLVIAQTVSQDAFDGSASQRWQAVPLTGADAGYFQLVSGLTSGPPGAPPLVLDILGGSTGAGAAVIIHAANSADNQKWHPVAAGAGTQRWQNKKSGLFLTVSSPSKGGAPLAQQPTGKPGQAWTQAPIAIDTLMWPGSQMVVDIPHGTKDVGVQLQLRPRKTGYTNQEFAFVPAEGPKGAEDLAYVIISRSSGLPLAATDSQTVIQTSWLFRARNQLWRRTPQSNNGTTTNSFESVGQPGLFIRPATTGANNDKLVIGSSAGASSGWAIGAVSA